MRTDPLTKSGKIDTKFFASDEYEAEQSSLLRYLKLEGFDSKAEDFTIEYMDRKWFITVPKKDK
jgi:hypothetical protein